MSPAEAASTRIELLVAVMAGVVLSFFLMVGEIALMRKRAKSTYAHLRHLYQSGSWLRLTADILLIAAFFLVQPFVVAVLVTLALDGLTPDFSTRALQELRQLL